MGGARAHLERLAARPRPAGSDAERVAREYCADRLRERGFDVREEEFEFSGWPGRFAAPACGAALILTFAAAGHVGWRGQAGAALALLLVGGAVVAGAARWLTRRGVLALPWRRERSTNLVATRGTPAVWLVAHLDSKSQPIPIAVRALGVMATIAVWVIAVAVSVTQRAGSPVAWLWPWLTVIGIVAAAPIVASVVGARSPGALDDASGVATVLLVAQQLHPDRPLGVLLTSAEELGLAGARAWAERRASAGAMAINIDGVDDTGALRFTHTGRRPVRLVDALLNAAGTWGVRAGSGPLLPGVLLDGVALADRGWEVITVSRGSWRTVARVHTPRDDLSTLTGKGVEETAGVVLHAIEGLR
jgi:hypothetical protein